MRRTAGVRTEMVWGRKSEIRRVRARLAEVAAEIRDGLPRELLESLALRFGAARPDAPVEALEEFLAVKAGEWEEFRAQLAAVANSDPRFAPARAAEAAVKRADFDGADALLAGAEAGHEAGVTARRRAALRVARAGVLLLKGDADGAAAQVEAAAGLLQPDAPEEAAALRHVAAGRLYEEARLAAGTGHARAIGLLRRNEAIWTRDRPEDWVKTQLCLGITLADLGVETAGAAGAALLADAAAAFRATLEVFTRDARPSDWAMAQLSLGYALLARAERSEAVEESLIAEALAAFAAGREAPRAALPEDWQRTHSRSARDFCTGPWTPRRRCGRRCSPKRRRPAAPRWTARAPPTRWRGGRRRTTWGSRWPGRPRAPTVPPARRFSPNRPRQAGLR